MIQLIDLRNEKTLPSPVVPRAQIDVDSAVEKVRSIITDVKEKGDVAVLDWTENLDGVRPNSLRVPLEIIENAYKEMPEDVINALKTSIERVKKAHENQIGNSYETSVIPDGKIKQKFLPINRVGLYVPGGQAVYPSSVVMNVVPAQVAGVKSIAVTSPAQKENQGWPNKTILAACKLLGIDEIYSAGGAQAVTMFAFGTKSCKKVSLITGPGNIYVTAAKRLVDRKSTRLNSSHT